MPILEAEVAIVPDNLLNGFAALHPERIWRALRTKSRQEKAVARALHGRDIPFFLPLLPKCRLVHGYKRPSFVPMFANYVFLFGTEEERVIALKTDRVVDVLADLDARPLVEDLRKIQLLIKSGQPITLESRLTSGDNVRVTQGPLRGLEGVVLARRKKIKLLIAVNLLQQGASVEVDDFMVQKI